MKKTNSRCILFINPAKEDNFLVSRIHLGFTLLASILTEAGHQVRVIDYAFLRSVSQFVNVPSIEEIIQEFQPDVIGVSVFTYLYDECLNFIERISACSHTPIILGGPHFTIFPDDFSSDKRVSYIVRGEAESIILDLVESAANEPMPVIVNAPPPPPESIPSINLEAAYGSEYLEDYQIQLSRGCPYKCGFCNIYMIAGRNVRARDLNVVIDQIVRAKKQHPRIKTITITDDCPTFNKDRFKRFLHMFKQADTGCMLYVDNMRADSIDDEMLALYKAAGGINICLGVESGHPEVFHLIHKGESLSAIVEAAKKVRQSGIVLGLCFVIGLPEDNLERHLESMRLAKRLRPNYNFWNMIVPWPGTEVARWYQLHGEVGEIRKFSTLIDPMVNFKEPVCSSRGFTKNQMVKAWLMANMETNSYFASPQNISKLFRLTIQYRTYRSFIILLFCGLPLSLVKRNLPIFVKSALKRKLPALTTRLRNILN